MLQINAALQALPSRPHEILTPLRPYTLPHRSPPSRSSPAVAAVLSPSAASLVIPTIFSTWRTSIVYIPSSSYITPPFAAVSSPAVVAGCRRPAGLCRHRPARLCCHRRRLRFSSAYHLFNVFHIRQVGRKIAQCSPNKDDGRRFEYTA